LEFATNFSTLGHTNITNNTSGPGSNPGYGIELLGGARLKSARSPAEYDYWKLGRRRIPARELGNLLLGWHRFERHPRQRPVGVAVGVGSQATFFNSAQISGHTSAGVDLYANAQAISWARIPCKATDPAEMRQRGIRIDGNSQALLRGGQISGNAGPGVLVLVNSSADFAAWPSAATAASSRATRARRWSAILRSRTARRPPACRAGRRMG